jgi:hypothetical protein
VWTLGCGGGGFSHPKAEKVVVFALGRGRWSDSSAMVVCWAGPSSLSVWMDVGGGGERKMNEINQVDRISSLGLLTHCSHFLPPCTRTLSTSFLSRYNINSLQILWPNLSDHSTRTSTAIGRNWVLGLLGTSTKVNPPSWYTADPPAHPMQQLTLGSMLLSRKSCRPPTMMLPSTLNGNGGS